MNRTKRDSEHNGILDMGIGRSLLIQEVSALSLLRSALVLG